MPGHERRHVVRVSDERVDLIGRGFAGSCRERHRPGRTVPPDYCEERRRCEREECSGKGDASYFQWMLGQLEPEQGEEPERPDEKVEIGGEDEERCRY